MTHAPELERLVDGARDGKAEELIGLPESSLQRLTDQPSPVYRVESQSFPGRPAEFGQERKIRS